MYSCTFLWDGDCPDGMETILRKVIVDLIKNKDIDYFLVGDEGEWNHLVHKILWELQPYYFNFRYHIIIGCMVDENLETYNRIIEDSRAVLPEELDGFPRSDAIERRNRYMLKDADFVVTNITEPSKFIKTKEWQGKTIVNVMKVYH